MAKFKVGDKVRILDVDSIDFGWKYFRNGDVTEVVSVTSHGKPYLKQTHTVVYPIGTASLVINKGEFHAIELVEDSANLSEEIYVLKRKVAELEERLTELEPEPTPEITYSVSATDLAELRPKKSANELRKEAIEKAEDFIGEVLSNDVYNSVFIVNEDKRTVVALVKGLFSGRVYRKGIAKCAPSDVFNVHIGKAIALGRAYGLDTTEFEQAPQPDEVVPGMEVIRFNKHGDYLGDERVDSVKVLTERGPEYAPESTHEINGCMLYGGYGDRIISDSGAQY